jgi:hypothetical protein
MLEMHSELFDFIQSNSPEHAIEAAPNPHNDGTICVFDFRAEPSSTAPGEN